MNDLTELQSRYTDTCEPAAWRCRGQETPWIHRGLGGPLRPLLFVLWLSPLERHCETTLNLKPQHSGSNERLAPFPDLLIPCSEAGLSPYLRLPPPAGVYSWTAAHQPGNADQVTRMKQSWLSAGFHCGSVSFRLTQAAHEGTHHRTDRAKLWPRLRINLPVLGFRVGLAAVLGGGI